ncbi:hypothetical protein [Streptomyces justiciae]|uniref:hypothetical protein n=1 Tax=Streptomyces justiciae TaxID=2780140 RepID=UPI002117D50D|nr:hypothetical protein [Streptomyces justiciae]MCW8383962.1 hypothetical protein [Streptomyces justiciae]
MDLGSGELSQVNEAVGGAEMGAQVVTVALATDGRSWVNGSELRSAADGTLPGARAVAFEEVTRIARQRRHPVRVEATDPDGTVWHFVVTEDGGVHDPDKARQLRVDPDAVEVPAEARSVVDEVVTAIEGGREHVAMKMARRLEEDLVARHGAGHPYALRALELRAHAVFACGMPSIGCELYTTAARGWHEVGSEAYWGAAQRAYALWHRIGDEPPAGTVWLGQQLVEVLELGGPRTSDTVRAILSRIDTLRLEA